MDPSTLEDSRLLSDAAEGNSRSFGVLYDRHRDRLFRHSLRITESVQDAEDLVALVFAEAWRKRGSVRMVDGSMLPWLLVTANYGAKNSARWHRRHRSFLASIPREATSPDPADLVTEKLTQFARDEQVRYSFDRLSWRDQEVLILCVLEDLSTKEAAAAMGVAIGTVKSRLARAKARLGAALPRDFAFELDSRPSL